MKIILVSTLTLAVIFIQLLGQQHQALAFPCSGGSGKEYCKGYHEGAVAADKDSDAMGSPNSKGVDVDNHPCHKSADYCAGFNKGYNDEAMLLS
jgi:hypothetical protein